jgi:hypothetical protein
VAVAVKAPAAPAKKDIQKREFYSGITKEFLMIVGLLSLAAVILTTIGNFLQSYLGISKGAWITYIGMGCILAILPLFYFNLGKSLIMTADDITYRDKNNFVTINWHELSDFQPPPSDSKFFRFSYLSNGRASFYIYSFNFNKFDLINSIITTARKRKYLHENVYVI